jgi:hypothetical protein
MNLLRFAFFKCTYCTSSVLLKILPCALYPSPLSVQALSSQSQYFTTDGQSASLSWCQGPIWDLRPNFFLSDSCGFVDVGYPLWQEDGSVFYNVQYIITFYMLLHEYVYTIYTRFRSVQAQYSRSCPIFSSFRLWILVVIATTALLLLRDFTTVMERCLLHHRLATGMFANPFSSKCSLCWLQNSGLQQTCRNTSVKLIISYIIIVNYRNTTVLRATIFNLLKLIIS